MSQWEGFSETPYLCPAGIPTIGFGRTGPDVSMATAPTTREKEEAWTKARLLWLWKRIDHDVGRDLNENQAAAVLSLCWNIGLGALQRSTLWHFLQDGQPGPAADQFLRWDKAKVDGLMVSVKGLQARRRAERELFLAAPQSTTA